MSFFATERAFFLLIEGASEHAPFLSRSFRYSCCTTSHNNISHEDACFFASIRACFLNSIRARFHTGI
ncbi:MAG: hypothetical protein ACK41D_04605, partial [Rubricoccaceae bacterium]